MTQKIIAIIAAIILVATVVFLVVAGKSLTQEQFFGVRLLLTLAAAGVVAVLPGFLRVEMSPLINVGVRGGGAVGVFILLMYVNPPIIKNLGPGPSVQHEGFLGNMRDHLNERVSPDVFSLVFRESHEQLSDFVVYPPVGGSTYGEVLMKICNTYSCLSCEPEPDKNTRRVTLSVKRGPLVETEDSAKLVRKKLKCP